jgi:hypothetical protein
MLERDSKFDRITFTAPSRFTKLKSKGGQQNVLLLGGLR